MLLVRDILCRCRRDGMRLATVLVVVCALVLTGCKSMRNAYADDIYDRPGKHQSAKHGVKGSAKHGGYKAERPKELQLPADEAARRVIAAAEKWLGTPYCYGGNSSEGTDCSGLTTIAYRDGAGIDLPRNSSAQAETGHKIGRKDLRPGDLVFFSRNKGGSGPINHVAIYAGEGYLLHATTSRGVCYTPMDDPYWAAHLHSFRRVL